MKQNKDELNKILENAGLKESSFMASTESKLRQDNFNAIAAADRIKRFINASSLYGNDPKYSWDGEDYEFTMISDVETILSWINHKLVDDELDESGRFDGYYCVERGHPDPDL